jgi:hypothetical protein
MKNELNESKNSLSKTGIRKILGIINVSIFLLAGCVLYSFAGNMHPQETRVTLNKQNVTLSEILEAIEQQTDYLFIFNQEVNVDHKVSIEVKNESVWGVLDKLLADTGVRYALTGTHIVLSRKELPSFASVEADAYQQSGRRITGIVTDTGKEPIIGANIIEKGTTNGTVTDIEGNFTLTVSDNAMLQISYIGYITQEISVLSAPGGAICL